MDEMGRQDIKKDNATVIRTDEGCWSVGTTFIYLPSVSRIAALAAHPWSLKSHHYFIYYLTYLTYLGRYLSDVHVPCGRVRQSTVASSRVRQ